MEEYEKIQKIINKDFSIKNKLEQRVGKEKIDKSIEDILTILNSINLSIYETNRLTDLVKHIYEVQRMFPQS